MIYKDSSAKLCKRIRVSFAQVLLKCQNLKLRTVGICRGQRSSYPVTKLYNYSEINYYNIEREMCMI